MVEENIDCLDKEVIEIFKHIKNNENFLLKGGAGSGKTFTLIQTIKEIFRRNPKSKVVCITYTNAAVNEICERYNHENLIVSTIHSFLWDTIKPFDVPLKNSLLDIINSDDYKIKNPKEEGEYHNEFKNGVHYLEFINIDEGIISHDYLLELSEYMYKKYKVLCDIFKDKYDYVFIDEFQDTHKSVIDIFLKHLNKSKKNCIFGFFGDEMQSIYDKRIGNLNDYDNYSTVIKEQNRRNPEKIINLANKIRNDGLKQTYSDDPNAPNIKNNCLIEGSISFLYSKKDLTMNDIKRHQLFEDWNFEDVEKTKELYLTYKLIAKEGNFIRLLECYEDYKDPVVKLIKKIKNNFGDDGLDSKYENKTLNYLVDYLGYEENISKMDMFEIKLYNFIKNFQFQDLKTIKSYRDMILNVEQMNKICFFMYTIMKCICFYEKKDYLNFIDSLNNNNVYINSTSEKNRIKEIFEDYINKKNPTINDVFLIFQNLFKGDNILDSIENKYNFEKIKNIPFLEFKNLFYHIEQYSPYSTQHNVKGEEYENVFLVLDNGNWNNYNFKYLFHEEGKPSVLDRTRKIFYVCCTRAMKNLIIFYPNPDELIINKAKEWVGEENIHVI